MPLLRRDGVALHHERRDGRGPPVVLLHGWCCDLSFLAPQYEHFARQGRAVAALDLRGHGRSDAPVQAYGMDAFADDVAWSCAQFGWTRPVVVGHSMGGNVAWELASRRPDLPAAIVMLDSAIARPAASRAALPQVVARLRGPDPGAVVREVTAHNLLLPTDDAARAARILDAMAATAPHVMAAAYEGLGAFDPAAGAGRIVAPSLYVYSNAPALLSERERMRELLPALALGQTVGSGHFCPLEVPEQVNAMLDRFLAVALGGAWR